MALTIPGFEARTTPKSGLRILRIEHTADPDKRAPEWLADMKQAYKSEAKFRREFLLDWTSSDTGPVYPEFRELYARNLVQLKAPGLVADRDGGVTVYRGWDFGVRRSACCWLQKSPTRWWLLRELMPEGLNDHELRDLVLALSGQLETGLLPERAAIWWQHLLDGAGFGYWPKPPWFGQKGGRPIRFVDYAGHEALQRSSRVETDPELSTSQAILAEKGIFLNAWAASPKAREEILRTLFMLRPDGHPGLLVDPACRILTTGFLGGISFQKPTEANPHPETARRDGYFEHLHDSVGYVLVNQQAAAGDYIPPPQAPLFHAGRGPVDYKSKAESLGFHDAWESF